MSMTPAEQMRKYRVTHPEYVHRSNNRVKEYMRNIRKNPEIRTIHVQRVRDWRVKLRQDIFNAYGHKCACCGEKERAFLQLDHVNGGGCKHRRSLSNNSSITLYLELRKQGFPPGYQILCANFNMAKAILGRCPHGGSEVYTK